MFKPSDLFAPGTDGEIGTVVEGGLRRQIYRNGELVEDFIESMPTRLDENGRFCIHSDDLTPAQEVRKA